MSIRFYYPKEYKQKKTNANSNGRSPIRILRTGMHYALTLVYNFNLQKYEGY